MSILKRENGIGIAKGTTWGTAVEPGTGNGLIVKTFTNSGNARDTFINDNEFDHDMPTIQTLGNYPESTGNLVLPFYYEGTEPMLASVFGKYGGVDNTGSITHTFTFDPTVSGIFQTIAFDEGDEVKAVQSAVISSMKMSVDEGMVLDFGYIGDRLANKNVVADAAFTTPLALTYVSTGVDKFKLLEAAVWMNDESAGALAVGDAICVSNIELNIERGFVSQDHCAGSSTISEPKEVNAPKISITLNFPKKDAANKAYFDDFEAGTLKKLKIKFTGALISGSFYNDFELNFPSLRIVNAPQYDQESPIPTTLEFEVLKASVAPTGMSAIVPTAVLENTVPILTGYPTV